MVADQLIDKEATERAAHSIYFQVLGEQGFVGLGIFVALIGSTFISLGRVARLTSITPGQNGLGKLSRAIQTGVTSFIVSGAFLSRAYFDLFYHLIAIAIILEKLAEQRFSAASDAAEEAIPASRRAPLYKQVK
jgi:hypothetical protein